MDPPDLLVDGARMMNAREHREGSLLTRGIQSCMKRLSVFHHGKGVVGVTHNPVSRFRWYYYQGWPYMTVLLRDHNAGRVHMFEAALIASLKALLLPCRNCPMAVGHELANRAPGGEGPMANFAPPYFAYIVSCEEEAQAPAEARRFRQGRISMSDWRDHFAEVEAKLEIFWQTPLDVDDGPGTG